MTPGSAWFLNNSSTNTVIFVDSADSDAHLGVTIQANNTGGNNTNSGRNINWNFGNTGQTVTATKTGNWSNSTTWDGGFVPNATNPVVIPNGFTVTVDVVATANSLTINNSGSTTGLTFSGANSLTVIECHHLLRSYHRRQQHDCDWSWNIHRQRRTHAERRLCR